MSGRGGIYTGPGGVQLHGDGRPVGSPVREVNEPAPKWKVYLTYFKPSGKYGYVGEYETSKRWMYEIFDEVRDLGRIGKLPGLGSGRWEGPIHVVSPDHPNAFPGLVMTFNT